MVHIVMLVAFFLILYAFHTAGAVVRVGRYLAGTLIEGRNTLSGSVRSTPRRESDHVALHCVGDQDHSRAENRNTPYRRGPM